MFVIVVVVVVVAVVVATVASTTLQIRREHRLDIRFVSVTQSRSSRTSACQDLISRGSLERRLHE